MLDITPEKRDALVALRATLRDRNCERMHYVANALPKSPYSRDSNGRLRRNGKYASKP